MENEQIMNELKSILADVQCRISFLIYQINGQNSSIISKEQTDRTSNLQGQIEMKSKSSSDTHTKDYGHKDLIDKDYDKEPSWEEIEANELYK